MDGWGLLDAHRCIDTAFCGQQACTDSMRRSRGPRLPRARLRNPDELETVTTPCRLSPPLQLHPLGYRLTLSDRLEAGTRAAWRRPGFSNLSTPNTRSPAWGSLQISDELETVTTPCRLSPPLQLHPLGCRLGSSSLRSDDPRRSHYNAGQIKA